MYITEKDLKRKKRTVSPKQKILNRGNLKKLKHLVKLVKII
jgi:hypothetical protein